MTRLVSVLVLAVAGAVLVSAQGRVAGTPTPQGPAGGRGGMVRGTLEEPTGSGAIKGRIVAAGTGAPIRRAQVRAVAAEARGNRLVSTDADGRFELRDLPAGRWQLTASKAGFVTLRFGQNRPFEAGRPIELGPGEVMERLEMALPRASAIVGRVSDEFGDPVAGARVQVLRYQTVQGTRRMTPVGVVDQSDDTGAFRLFGLMPGEYYVSASLRAIPVDEPGGEGAGYAPTYYPGTNNLAEAQPITLAVGQEQTNLNFALLPVRTVRVSGVVIDSTGGPLTNGNVSLTTADGNAFGAGRGNIRGNGAFSMADVAPGTYTLTVGGGRGRQGGAALEVAQMPLTVGNQDITTLFISTTRGASLSGTVAAAPGSAGTLPSGGVQITTQSASPEPGGFGFGVRPGRVEEGAFTVTGLIGQRFVRVNGLSSSWMVHSMTLDGMDVTDTPLTFRPNEEIRGLRVLLTDRVTDLSGKVSAPDGSLSRDFSVVIFPDDEMKWTPGSRYLRSGRPDQDGVFKLRALPPEPRYLAVAVSYLEEGEGTDPRFLAQIRDRALRFSLNDGETRVLDLKLIER